MGHADVGHAVYAALLARGWPHSIAKAGAHLAAVGGPYNWQGCPRIASLMGRSTRTVQRARAALELAGLVKSYCLDTGDQLEGMRAPVWRPQVVRDVTALQRLVVLQVERVQRHVATKGLTPRRRPPPSARPSAADRAPGQPQELVTRAELVAFTAGLAEALKRPPVRSTHGGAAAGEADQSARLAPVQAAPPAKLVGLAHEPHVTMPAPELAEPERVTPERCRAGRDSPTERGPPS